MTPRSLSASPAPFRRFAEVPAAIRRHIALVSQGYPPRDTSGIARWTHELARALAARGHHVHVITAAQGPRVVEYAQGVWVHSVPPRHDATEMGPVDLPPSIRARAAAVLQEALRIQRDFGLDVVSAPIWDIEGILCAAHLSIPVITSLHTSYRMVLPLKEKWRSDLRFRLHHVEKVIAAETWLLRHSALLLANSREICREMEALYGVTPPRVAVVPHGVAPAPTLPAQAESSGQRILFVGRIERRKGVDLLLRAALPLLDKYPDATLDIVGSPVPEEEAFATEIATLRETIAARGHASRVIFHGYVDEAALARHYAACDIFVAPSRFESFGLIAIEAMRYGKPVVAAGVGGLAEIVEPGRSGELFVTESVTSLRDALRRLLSNAALRRRLGQGAATSFARRFTSATMAEQVELCLRDLLSPGAAAPIPRPELPRSNNPPIILPMTPRAPRRPRENTHGPDTSRAQTGAVSAGA